MTTIAIILLGIVLLTLVVYNANAESKWERLFSIWIAMLTTALLTAYLYVVYYEGSV